MSAIPRKAARHVIEPQGRYFEDFQLGQVIRHPTPRTLSAGDAAVYLSLTGSRHAAWSSQPLARQLGFDRMPLHDLLVFNVAFGKTVPDISVNAVANLGYAELRFLAPVYPEDTLRCESVVIGLKPNSSGRTGVVYVRSTAYRDDETAVLVWVRWVMVARRDPGASQAPAHVPQLAPLVPPERLVVADRLRPAPVLEDWCDATGSQDLWDSYAAGDRILHPGGVTVEEADHMTATRLYQNNSRVHFDALATRASPVGRRLVYGGHVISLCHALSFDGLENVLGVLAINAGTHAAPIVAGDTLRASTEVLERWKLPGRSDVGALRLRLLGVKNGNPADLLPPGACPAREAGEHAAPTVVLDLDYTVLVPRRPPARHDH